MRLDSCSIQELLRSKSKLRRQLQNHSCRDLRIAVLRGSTVNEMIDFAELFLLVEGFRCTFYQSEYNKYYEEAVLDSERIVKFRPDIVYVHTSCMNLQGWPPLSATEADHESFVAAEFSRFQQIWHSLQQNVGSHIIQNNFELPPFRVLGNVDSIAYGGRARFVNRLNVQFANEALNDPRLFVQDVNALSAALGTRNWFDWERWYSYKIMTTPAASLALARSVTAIVRSLYGRSRKCLVLDLDNTLWGGVIGDDGPENIKIGRETAVGEAYTAFQEYCLMLRSRGILLAVCSKNDEETAKHGFEHPDSVLKLSHFSAFRANWEPKHENLTAIAKELNLGIDSLVFVDDNPAERALVASQLPMVAVPDVGSDVTRFIPALEAGGYFETVRVSAEDFSRADTYAANSQRALLKSKFRDYGEYLDSLQMTAEIDAFKPVYLDRITQLTNKTNQFNLTTRRYTAAEIQKMSLDPAYITLYGKLTDAFGDNGLVSVIVGRKDGSTLHIELWLMSCRVLKRDLELAMLDELVTRAQAAGIETIVGYYYRTPRNSMVADHYRRLGFECESQDPDGGQSMWRLQLTTDYQPKRRYIQVRDLVHT
jgi:FkbH-like protein